MASYSFNGTVCTIAGVGSIRVLSATHSEGTGKIDITGSEQSEHQYEATLNDPEVTFECLLGTFDVERGDTGITTIVWNDGSPDTSLGTCVVVGKSRSGSIDGNVVHSITVVPAEA